MHTKRSVEAPPSIAVSVSRRAFVTALSGLPLALTFGCNSDEGPSVPPGESDSGSPGGLSASERERHRSLVDAYVQAQAARDIDAALAFFSADSKVTLNGRVFEDLAAIRALLVEQGVAQGGGLEAARVEAEHWFFTDDALLVEGRVYGKHVGEAFGFPATHQDVELAYLSFCQFDGAGRFTTCRTTMNWLLLTG